MTLSFPRLSKYYYLRVKRLKGDPDYLAKGFAFGVFVGNLPLMPQTLIMIPATMLLRISTIAAFVSSTIVNNPLTMTFQYYLSWKIGCLVLPNAGSWQHLKAVLLTGSLVAVTGLGLKTLAVLLIGGTVIGLISSVLSYFLSRQFFVAMRRKRAMKHRLDNR
jgi:hypothetical protein